MADVTANIILTTTGGDAAAGEVDKASHSLKRLRVNSGDVEQQFQHRFQHIGLMLFAGDALRAAGLGRETRMVISSLNLALQEGAAAAGISSGGVMLLVTALLALAGIAVKVIAHHKDQAEALEKVADASLKSAQAANKEVDAIAHYVEMGGRLTALEKQEYAAKQDLANATKHLADMEMMQAIPAINQHIIALQAQRAHLVAQAATVNALSETWLAKYIPPFMLAAAVAKHFVGSGEELRTKLGEIDVELQKQITKLKEYQVAVVDLRHDNDATWDSKLQNLKNERETEKKVRDEIRAERALERKEMDALIEGSVKEHQKAYQQEEQAVKHLAGQIGSDLGNAFAKTLVEGKDFTEQMQQAFTNMAEQIIADIVRMIVEWEILTALGFPAAGGGAGILSAFGGGFATGGSRVVDRPTLFMAGEAGPEIATFSPMATGASSGDGGQGGDTHINIQVTANGVSDPNELARMVGPALIQEIRGQGNLNFTRA